MADAVARSGSSGGTAAGSGGSGSGTGNTSGMVSRLIAFYHGVMAEMRKVTWPDRPQVRSATIAILIFVMLIGLVITILDYALQGIIGRLIPNIFAR